MDNTKIYKVTVVMLYSDANLKFLWHNIDQATR